MARLVPLQQPVSQRMPGRLKGKIWISPDFDAPMTKEELAEWYGDDDDLG